MANVDCQECSRAFPTFKLYIKHLLAKECQAKKTPEPMTTLEPELKKPKLTPPKTVEPIQQQPDSTTNNDELLMLGSPTFTNSKSIYKSHAYQVKKTSPQILPEIIPINAPPIITPTIISVASLANKKPLIPVIDPKKNGKPQKELCMLCSKPCKGKRGVSGHMSTSHKCHYCGEHFAILDEHIKEVHERETCEYCSRKFPSTGDVDKHLQSVHFVKCEQCDEGFYVEQQLKDHVIEEHETETCDICDQKMLIKDKLMDEHKDKIHGIKTMTKKEFGGGMMFMMVSE